MRGAGSCAVVRGWTNQTPSEPHALIAAGRTSTATAMIKSLAATPLSTALQFWAMAAFPLFFLLFKYFRDLFPALCYSRLYPNTAPWMNEISQRRLVRTPTASHCNMNIKKPLLFVIWITTGKKSHFKALVDPWPTHNTGVDKHSEWHLPDGKNDLLPSPSEMHFLKVHLVHFLDQVGWICRCPLNGRTESWILHCSFYSPLSNVSLDRIICLYCSYFISKHIGRPFFCLFFSFIFYPSLTIVLKVCKK